jgi:hypothetical protein
MKWLSYLPLAALVACGAGEESSIKREVSGGASADVSVAAVTGWQVQYFANKDLMGNPVWGSFVDDLNFNWGAGSPAPAVPVDQFSARFTRSGFLAGGLYDVFASSDDGIRVFVDGHLLIQDWTDHGLKAYNSQISLVDGFHTVVVEYYENTGGAAVSVQMSRRGGGVIVPPVVVVPPPVVVVPPPAGNGWQAQYFANPDLSGRSISTVDSAIQFQWGQGGPAILGGQNDFFSVRWTRTQFYQAGEYVLKTKSDDGVRVYVDGALQIDAWRIQSLAENKRKVFLSQGIHTIVVEYYENNGDAAMSFAIDNAASCPTLKANILACVAPWTPENQAFVKICRWENGGCAAGSESVRTSFASDGGQVKFDGLEFNACTPVNERPRFLITQSMSGQTTAQEIVLLTREGDIRVGFCQ